MALLPPIRKIDDLNDEWDKDTIRDYHDPNLDLELLKIPSLHAKYCRIRSYHKQRSINLESNYRTMKELRRLWIEGKSDLETLKEHKWDQYQDNPITTRSAQENKLDCDPILNEIIDKIKVHDFIVEQCDMYIKELNGRTYVLRGVIDNRRYLKGHE